MKIEKMLFCEIILFIVYMGLYSLTFGDKNNVIYIFVFGVLLVGLLIAEYRRTNNFNSPLIFWYISWLLVITIGRMDLKVYSFDGTWTDELQKIIVWNTSVFFGGFWIGELFGGNLKKKKTENISYDILANWIIFFLILACSAYIINVLDRGMVPQFTENVNAYRLEFVTTKYYSIVNCCRFVYAFIPFIIKYTKSTTKKKMVVCLGIILAAFELLTGWRSYTFQILIIFFTSQFSLLEIKIKKEKKKRFRQVCMYAVIAIAVISVIAITRQGVSFTVDEGITYVLQILYLYMAPNFLNFQTAMSVLEPKGYFLYSTEALWGLFLESDSILGFENINQAIGGFNVSSYLLQPYADCGFLGTLLWTALIALCAGYICSRCRKRGTDVKKILFWAIVNVSIFFMHNSFFLRSSSPIIWIILTCAVVYLSRYKKCSQSFSE